MRLFSGPGVLIVDELGYLSMPTEDASALFQVIARRYLKGSVILATNRGVALWRDIFSDTTIVADTFESVGFFAGCGLMGPFAGPHQYVP
jgi:DNA replication protein DnaC